MKKPNFFIIGAPKCGTTSLAYWLSEHPSIYFSPKKEPFYFDHDWPRPIRTLKSYEELFRDAGPEHIAVGEGSTGYLFSDIAIPKVLEYSPAAKFIVCLRNPVEIAPSLHAQRLSSGLETIKNFESAWNADHERRQGKKVPFAARKYPQRMCYRDYCRVGRQLERLYELVPRSRVLTLLLEDMKESPRDVYLKVLSFLNVEDDGRVDFPKENTAKKTKSATLSTLSRIGRQTKYKLGFKFSLGTLNSLKRWNVVTSPRSALSEPMRAELLNYFYDDIKLLQDLTGRDLSSWLI